MERVQQAWSSWGRWWTCHAHLTRADARRHGFTRLSPVSSLVLLLTLLAVSAGCEIPMMEENPAGMQEYFDNRDIFLLGLFAVAIVFILLAAGVRIKIPALGRFRPPDNSTGRILLAVLGVSMLSFLAVFRIAIEPADKISMDTEPFRPDAPIYFEKSVELPSIEGPRVVSGAVSFDDEKTVFKEIYSKLTIYATGKDAEGAPIEFDAEVDRDGRFAFDVPASTRAQLKVTWSADNLGDYVLWPIEINVPAWQAIGRMDISFTFEKVDNFFYNRKKEAIEAVRACEIERADDILTVLLPVLKWFFDQNPNSPDRTWPHDIHRDLANKAERVAKLKNCAQDRSTFERKWRREAIERATKLESSIRAMNMWAGYSTQVYLQNKRAWPDLTLEDVDLDREKYRDLLRADMELVLARLAEDPVREFVPAAVRSPAIAGCLNDGQRDALQLFESVLSEPESVNLNRMMNVISGLRRIVVPEWLLGTWIDYPDEGRGEIKVVVQRVLNGFEYHVEIRHYPPNEGRVFERLTFTPTESAPCRFTINGSPGRRSAFIVRSPGQDGPLYRESDGQKFCTKPS